MIRPKKRISLLFDCDVEKVVARLREMTRQRRTFPFLSGKRGTLKPYIGKVGEENFKIWPDSKFSPDPPVIIGRMTQDGSNVKIDAVAKQGLFSMIVSWFALVGACVGVVLTLRMSGDPLLLAFLGFAVCVSGFMLLVGRVMVAAEAEAFRNKLLYSFPRSSVGMHN